MAELTVQTIEEKDIETTIKLLKKNGELLEDGICPLCNDRIGGIGGFIPYKDKVAPICGKLSCTLKASYEIMKFNGNGSPIID